MAIRLTIDTSGAIKSLNEVKASLKDVGTEAVKTKAVLDEAFRGSPGAIADAQKRTGAALDFTKVLERQTEVIKNVLAKQQQEISTLLKLSETAKKLQEQQKKQASVEQDLNEVVRKRIEQQAALASAVRQVYAEDKKQIAADIQQIETARILKKLVAERAAILGELNARKEADAVLTLRQTQADLRRVSALREIEKLEKDLSKSKGVRQARQQESKLAVDVEKAKELERQVSKLQKVQGQLAASSSRLAQARLRELEVANQSLNAYKDLAKASGQLKFIQEDLAKGTESLIRKQIRAAEQAKTLQETAKLQIRTTDKATLAERKKLEIARLSAQLKEKEIQLEAQLAVAKERAASAGLSASKLRELEFMKLKEQQLQKLAKLEAQSALQKDAEAQAVAKKIRALEAELATHRKMNSTVHKSVQSTELWVEANRRAALFAAEFRAALNALGLGFGIFTGSTILAATAIYGVVRAFRNIVSTGSEFELSMDRAKAVMNATASQAALLDQEVKRLAKTTIFTAKEAAEGLVFLGMAGFNTNEALQALDPTLKLAQIGMIGVAEAADQVTNIMAAFGITAEGISSVVDKLAVVVTNSNTSMSQLAQAISYVGPAAAETATSIEDVSALIGVFANRGVKASRAGTALRRGIANLSNPTDKIRKRLAELGIQVTGVDGRMRSLKDIVIELSEAGATVSDIFTIFGARAGPTFAGAILSGRQELEELLSLMHNSSGAAQDLQDKLQDNVWSKFKLLVSAVTDVALKLYEAMKDDLSVILDTVTRGVQALANNIGILTGAFKLLLAVGVYKLGAGLLSLAIGSKNLKANLVALVASTKVGESAMRALGVSAAVSAEGVTKAAASSTLLARGLTAVKAVARTFLPAAIILSIYEFATSLSEAEKKAKRFKSTIQDVLPVIDKLSETAGVSAPSSLESLQKLFDAPLPSVEKLLEESETPAEKINKLREKIERLRAITRGRLESLQKAQLPFARGAERDELLKESQALRDRLATLNEAIAELDEFTAKVGDRLLNMTTSQIERERRIRKEQERLKAERKQTLESIRANNAEFQKELSEFRSFVDEGGVDFISRVKTSVKNQTKEFNEALKLITSGSKLALQVGKEGAIQTLNAIKESIASLRAERDKVRGFLLSEISKNSKLSDEAVKAAEAAFARGATPSEILQEATKAAEGGFANIKEFKAHILDRINEAFDLRPLDFKNFDEFASYLKDLTKSVEDLDEQQAILNRKLTEALREVATNELVDNLNMLLKAQTENVKTIVDQIKKEASATRKVLTIEFKSGSRSLGSLLAESARVEQESSDKIIAAYDATRTQIENNISLLKRKLEVERGNSEASSQLASALKAQEKALIDLNGELDRLLQRQKALSENTKLAVLNSLTSEYRQEAERLRDQINALGGYEVKLADLNAKLDEARRVLEQAAKAGASKELIKALKAYVSSIENAKDAFVRLREEQLRWQKLDTVQQANKAAKEMGQAFTEFFINPTIEGLQQLEQTFVRVIQRILAERLVDKLFRSKDSGGYGLSDLLTNLFANGGLGNGSGSSGKSSPTSGKITGVPGSSKPHGSPMLPPVIVNPVVTPVATGSGTTIVNNFTITVGDVADKEFVRREISRSINQSVAKVATEQNRYKKPIGVR
jgi:TP901 family phage tail tape measure protein